MEANNTFNNQNQFNDGNFDNSGLPPQNLPNATAIIVMGILSIITACCCYGVVGVILGIVSMTMANKAKGLYNSNPNSYTATSLNNVNIGRICAIIGIVLGILIVIFYIIMISIFGFDTLSDPTKMQDMMREMQNR